MSPIRRARPTSRPSPSARTSPSPIQHTTPLTSMHSGKGPSAVRAPFHPSNIANPRPSTYLHTTYQDPPQTYVPWHAHSAPIQGLFMSNPSHPYGTAIEYRFPEPPSDLPYTIGTPDLSIASPLSAVDALSTPSSTHLALEYVYYDDAVELGRSAPRADNTPLAAAVELEHATEFPFPSQQHQHHNHHQVVPHPSPARDLTGMLDMWGLNTPYAKRTDESRVLQSASMSSLDLISPLNVDLRSPHNAYPALPIARDDYRLFSPMEITRHTKHIVEAQPSQAVPARLDYSSTQFLAPYNTPNEAGPSRQNVADSPDSFYTPRSDLATPGSRASAAFTAGRYSRQASRDAADLFSPAYSMKQNEATPASSLEVAARSRSPSRRPVSPRYNQNAPLLSCTPSPASSQIMTPSTNVSVNEVLDHTTLPESFLQRYRLTDELGAGGYGFVYAAMTLDRESCAQSREVAVKFIYKHRMAEHDFPMYHGIPVEAFVLSKLNHPSIVRFIEFFESQQYFILVQELHGDPWDTDHTLKTTSDPNHSEPAKPLNAFIQPSQLGDGSPRPRMGRRASYDLFEAVETVRFTEEEAREIFVQIASGVEYMHARGIFHRDLKDENIVIDHDYRIKIIDFGSAVIEKSRGKTRFYNSFRGTASYASPEIQKGTWYAAGPADIWCLGIIMSILLTGEQPFGNSENAMRCRYRKPRAYTDCAANLMDGMLQRDPDRRFDIRQIMQHPWIRGPIDYRIPRHHELASDREYYGCRANVCRIASHRPETDRKSNGHAITHSDYAAEGMRDAQAQMMDAVAIPMYETDQGLMGYVSSAGSVMWAQEQNYHPN